MLPIFHFAILIIISAFVVHNLVALQQGDAHKVYHLDDALAMIIHVGPHMHSTHITHSTLALTDINLMALSVVESHKPHTGSLRIAPSRNVRRHLRIRSDSSRVLGHLLF